MKMTVETYMNLSASEAAKLENIASLLENDRALYDLELKAKNKLSPAFIEKAMPAIVKMKDFEGSFNRYKSNILNPLSNFKIFYDRLHEYSVRPTKENKEKNTQSQSNTQSFTEQRKKTMSI